MIRRVRNLIILILIFFSLTLAMDSLDDTTKWANVVFPSLAVQGQSYTVTLKCTEATQNAEIRAKMQTLGHDGRPLPEYEDQNVTISQSSGATSFGFSIPVDPNAESVCVSIACESEQGQLFPDIRSSRIEILPPDDPKVIVAYARPLWQNALIDAWEKGYWRTNRGDKTFIGWGITGLYALIVVICLYCTGVLDKRGTVAISQIYAWFWWIMASLLLLMGINKQLDLQMLLADIGRSYTQLAGWYGQRKPFQIRVLAFGACIGLWCLLEIWHRLKRGPKSTWFAMIGVLIIGLNTLVHLISLHWTEHLLRLSLSSLHVEEALEIASLVWIGLAAWYYNVSQREEVCYIIQ